MKKAILIALTLVTSFSAMAVNNLTCGIFENYAGGKPAKRIVVDLDQERANEVVFISSVQTFSITKSDDTIAMGFSEAEGMTRTVLSLPIIKRMKSGESLGIFTLDNNDKAKTNSAVCYLTGESDQAHFDM